MGKRRKKYDREFKISVIRELESGTSPGVISRKHNIHPTLPNRWKREYYDDPDNAFSGNGNIYKKDARISELETLVGQLYAENAFLKKTLTALEKRGREQRNAPMSGRGT